MAAIIGRSASDIPAWDGSLYARLLILLLGASVVSLAWSLRWFWVVLRPRQYEYPAPHAQVQRYAKRMTAYNQSIGGDDNLDARTLAEMRLFMINQHGSAAATNLIHNATKLKARPKVLLFMLLSFVLAFACEATIFIQAHIIVAPVGQKG